MPGAVAFALLVACAMVSCSRQTTLISTTPGDTRPVLGAERGDTLTYAIAFADKEHRRQFTRTFESFLERFPYSPVRRDSLAQTVVVRILPPSDSGEADVGMEAAARDSLVEQLIGAAVDSFAPPAPSFGGSVVIYSEREFWDDNLGALLRAYPSAPGTAESTADSSGALLGVRQVSPKRVAISLPESLRNAAGKPVSAFDLAGQWSAFVREQPAEGLALFRHVKGLLGFIRGRETVVPGFAVSGNDAVALVLDEADEEVLARLATSRLVPPALKLGPYALEETRGRSSVVVANRQGHAGPPYLDRCTVVLGRDRNPLVTFSLRKYDCVVVTTRKDIEYARRTLAGESRLIPLPAERYFLSLNCPTADGCRALRTLVHPGQLLASAAACDGEVIGALERDAAAVSFVGATDQLPSEPVIVLYRSGDPVSARIADKLLADLVQARLSCELRGVGDTEYGRALVDRAYTVAIGWVGERVMADRAEQLRLATMWFADRTDEPGRLAEGMEAPLFTVRRQVLCRNEVRFAGDTVADVYVQRPPLGKEQNHGGQ